MFVLEPQRNVSIAAVRVQTWLSACIVSLYVPSSVYRSGQNKKFDKIAFPYIVQELRPMWSMFPFPILVTPKQGNGVYFHL